VESRNSHSSIDLFLAYPAVFFVMDLRTLDLQLFTHGSGTESKALAKALVESFRDHGFVKLINHGIPEETVSEYMQAVRMF
jgi:isopenicillin N synthase-like dioxygenase